MKINPLFKDQLDVLTQIANNKHPVKIDEYGEPWLYGKRGYISPYSTNKLGVYVTGKVRVKQYGQLPFLKPHQVGDEEGYFLFSLSDFNKVKRLVGLRTKRVLTPEHKAKLMGASLKYRFTNGSN